MEEVKEITCSTTCSKCGTTKELSEGYDAYYCPSCNEWLEEACTDPECSFCVGRPQKPLSK